MLKWYVSVVYINKTILKAPLTASGHIRWDIEIPHNIKREQVLETGVCNLLVSSYWQN